jgi:hypothetical protein
MCMRMRGIRIDARPVPPANSVDEARPACSFLRIVRALSTLLRCYSLVRSLARSNWTGGLIRVLMDGQEGSLGRPVAAYLMFHSLEHHMQQLISCLKVEVVGLMKSLP